MALAFAVFRVLTTVPQTVAVFPMWYLACTLLIIPLGKGACSGSTSPKFGSPSAYQSFNSRAASTLASTASSSDERKSYPVSFSTLSTGTAKLIGGPSSFMLRITKAMALGWSPSKSAITFQNISGMLTSFLRSAFCMVGNPSRSTGPVTTKTRRLLKFTYRRPQSSRSAHVSRFSSGTCGLMFE